MLSVGKKKKKRLDVSVKKNVGYLLTNNAQSHCSV